MEGASDSLKNKGQILIEGIFFLVVCFGFLFTVIWLEKTVKERIRLESLSGNGIKNKKSRKSNQRRPLLLKNIL